MSAARRVWGGVASADLNFGSARPAGLARTAAPGIPPGHRPHNRLQSRARAPRAGAEPPDKHSAQMRHPF